MGLFRDISPIKATYPVADACSPYMAVIRLNWKVHLHATQIPKEGESVAAENGYTAITMFFGYQVVQFSLYNFEGPLHKQFELNKTSGQSLC